MFSFIWEPKKAETHLHALMSGIFSVELSPPLSNDFCFEYRKDCSSILVLHHNTIYSFKIGPTSILSFTKPCNGSSKSTRHQQCSLEPCLIKNLVNSGYPESLTYNNWQLVESIGFIFLQWGSYTIHCKNFPNVFLNFMFSNIIKFPSIPWVVTILTSLCSIRSGVYHLPFATNFILIVYTYSICSEEILPN